ncbi:MAG: S8 family serine peptidase [Actinomycetota bacterium]
MPARPPSRSLLVVAVTSAVVATLAAPAGARFPYPEPGGGQDPYAYQDYMASADWPHDDIGGDRWKYESRTACEIPGHEQNCSPLTSENPQELFGVTGASVDKAWEETTGRPDVVIAVHDSGVKWDDVSRNDAGELSGGAMLDLNNKTWLNRGELPQPDWGTPHPKDAHDRNHDGIFNIEDYCPNWGSPGNCGGDSRVSDLNSNTIVDPEDLIFEFSDGLDQDGNGYVDDFVGWDSYEDDNDPYDEVQYGHGTGEAEDSTGEVDNGAGGAGVCPNCMVMHMRVGDSFIADVNDFGQGVLYATDNGASVIQSALGTLNNSRFAQEAIDYAYRRGVVLIASAADESAGHHNQPSVLEHAVTMNSIGEPEIDGAPPPSYLEFRGCTNYGAYITAAVPSNSCSSEAVGRSAGMAGLIYAAARNEVAKDALADYGELDGEGGVPAGRSISAEEVDQIISSTADDMNFVEPPYEAQPKYAVETQRYPATPGWDPFFGYGRVNARRMVQAVAESKVPPEADLTSPKWFDIVSPDSGPIEIEGRAAALRAAGFSYTVEWGVWSWRDVNSAPAYSDEGVTLAHPRDLSGPVEGALATIDPAAVEAALDAANAPFAGAEGPAVDPVTGRGDHENHQIPDRFGVIVRLEVTAKDATGAPLTDIDGEPLTGLGTKNFNFHSDPALFAGFPIDLRGDGAASPRFADIDDDGTDELVVATSNGLIHAYEADGTEVEGWPVHTSDADLNYGAPAYSSGEITTPVHAAVLRSPSVGDLDRDGDLEVVAGDFQGRVWAFDSDGGVLDGFPVRSNAAYSTPQRPDREAGFYASHTELVPGDYPGSGPLPNDPDLVPDLVNRHDKLNRVIWWFLAAPTLANIDASTDELEIIAGAGDRHIYAFHFDGSPVAGWPVLMRDPATTGSVDPVTHEVANKPGIEPFNGAKVVVSPAVGDVDGDGTLEIIATVNEQYKETPNTDDPAPFAVSTAEGGNQRVYALYPDGSAHGDGPGGPGGHPNPNAFLPGWPAKIATVTLELLPVVGDGPDGSPVLGNVNGGDDLETGIFATAGPAYILGPDGRSIYGRSGELDRTLLTEAVGAATNSPDAPSIPAVGGGIFTRLGPEGGLAFAAPAAGAGKLVDVVLPEDQLVSDNHLTVWDLRGSRAQLPAFPREVNDLQFLATPASADIDGDGGEEVLEGTAYSDLHAFDATGAEPGLRDLAADGWPKFTGGWTVGPPGVGDLDDDGKRDVAHTIREGALFVWRGNGAGVCDPATWPEFGHDGWTSNNVETDASRPAVVTDLAATAGKREVTLTWTAPGDDGTCGRAHSYDVRFSKTPITTDNFSSSQPVEGEPAPGEPGTGESFTFKLPRCDGHVAIRTYDADPASDSAVRPANVSAASEAIPVEGRASSCGGGKDRGRAVAMADVRLGSRHPSDGPLPA